MAPERARGVSVLSVISQQHRSMGSGTSPLTAHPIQTHWAVANAAAKVFASIKSPKWGGAPVPAHPPTHPSIQPIHPPSFLCVYRCKAELWGSRTPFDVAVFGSGGRALKDRLHSVISIHADDFFLGGGVCCLSVFQISVSEVSAATATQKRMNFICCAQSVGKTENLSTGGVSDSPQTWQKVFSTSVTDSKSTATKKELVFGVNRLFKTCSNQYFWY